MRPLKASRSEGSCLPHVVCGTNQQNKPNRRPGAITWVTQVPASTHRVCPNASLNPVCRVPPYYSLHYDRSVCYGPRAISHLLGPPLERCRLRALPTASRTASLEELSCKTGAIWLRPDDSLNVNFGQNEIFRSENAVSLIGRRPQTSAVGLAEIYTSHETQKRAEVQVQMKIRSPRG